MTDEDKRANRRVPVALRIRLRYQDVDQFISKFAVNVSRGGMFLSSRNPKPRGTRLQFEMRLADESPVIEGAGEVRWIREYDRSRPNEPYGMGIQFTQLTPESRALIDRIIEHRRSMGDDGEDDDAIPMSPEGFVGPDGERATASASMVIPVETMRRSGSTAPPPVAPQPMSGPHSMPMIDSGPLDAAPPPAATPATVTMKNALPPPPRAKPATAPPPVPVMPPAKRRSAKTTSDLVGYLGSEPPALRAAMERARALAGRIAGSELDRELALLLGDDGGDAVPEVTVDAASRELAERLGGDAVTARMRASVDRSQPVPVGDEHTGGSMPIDPDDILDEADEADDAQAAGRRR